MDYISSLEVSRKWGISERMVREYCSKGRVLNAYLEGKVWMIPCDANKPNRKRRVNKAPRILLKALQEEKSIKLPGGIYHKLQVEMTYSSNNIEGSKLSIDQTKAIFETNTIGVTSNDESIKVDDIVEARNHFRCIDYVIDNAKKKLSESMIKQLHYLLKQNTSDSFISWFKVGDYKALENEVGDIKTSKPQDVSKDMKNLLEEYNSKTNIKVEDIMDFHYKFETIHPFQDGNGRVGRLIMLKECLKHNIVPILIKSEFKDFYYRGLKEYKTKKGYLVDTCLHGQDIFEAYLTKFNIKNKKDPV